MWCQHHHDIWYTVMQLLNDNYKSKANFQKVNKTTFYLLKFDINNQITRVLHQLGALLVTKTLCNWKNKQTCHLHFEGRFILYWQSVPNKKRSIKTLNWKSSAEVADVRLGTIYKAINANKAVGSFEKEPLPNCGIVVLHY